MCYLKNISCTEQVDFSKLWDKSEESADETPSQEENVLIPCSQKEEQSIWSKDQEMLVKLFSTIEKNNHIISRMSKLLNSTTMIESSDSNLVEQTIHDSHQNSQCIIPQKQKSSDCSLVTKIFGQNKYKYHFQMSTKFPNTIYKERNFEIKLQLCDCEGNPVQNGNLINICLAACTSEGQWIHQNRVGECFLKGKTEIELYHGQGLFQKIYTRDISRGYPGKKINFVVYGKPSMILFTNQGQAKKHVDPSEIEPLVIEEITVKAKKKQ